MSRLTHSWMHPDCETRDSKCGRGMFARIGIPERTIVMIQGGHVMPIREEPVFSIGADFAIQISDDYVLGAKYEHEMEDTDFVNHSCDPNAGWKGQIFLVTMRNIQADEEITFDYATAVTLEGYGFRCDCGAINCRGQVTSRDWMLPEIQKRHAGWFQWYLQDKIERLRLGNV